MQARFLLGPAGSGKTYRCLEEIRAELERAPEGLPLVFLAPKQATFQLERQLLADATLAGYARLHILSFERLAGFIFEALGHPPPTLLDEEGRVMVLRALLARNKESLKVFRATSRLPGFARHLSQVLRELQRYHLDPDRLLAAAQRIGSVNRLDHKLHDLALLLRAYRGWLEDHQLRDADLLLDLAKESLQRVAAKWPTEDAGLNRIGRPEGTGEKGFLRDERSRLVDRIWVDGFAQMTPQERHLLRALLPFCQDATLAFCLESEPGSETAWYSPWALLRQTFRQCHLDLSGLTGVGVAVEILGRRPEQSRFGNNPVLRHLERWWADPRPYPEAAGLTEGTGDGREHQGAGLEISPNPTTATTGGVSAACPVDGVLRVFSCANPEAEAVLAARETLNFVRKGNRYRDVAVQVRRLELYQDEIRRVFTRYGIPIFIDRRENVAHHPLAELTRSALRTLAYGWKHEDWFGALKSGLVPAAEHEIDGLENEALAHGWEGAAWRSDFHFADEPGYLERLNGLRRRLTAPFQALAKEIGEAPTGPRLAGALRAFWEALAVGRTLEKWSEGRERVLAGSSEAGSLGASEPVHATVWEQMQVWLENVALAFSHEAMPLTDWLPVLEAGLSGLTVGVVPPALDQVLVGAIDRSRNPDLKLAIVLGLNETVFPALPSVSLLLTEADRDRMQDAGYDLGPGMKVELGHEWFYGYIACTRPRERLLLTHAWRDGEGRTLNPSVFLKHLQRLFPSLNVTEFSSRPGWRESVHPSELLSFLLKNRALPTQERDLELAELESHPVLVPVLERLSRPHPVHPANGISPALAEQLYGPVLETSVSRIEKFASCPFRFFVDSGLRVEERKKFELDIRQQGSFQHEVLARFHEELAGKKLRWRDLTPGEARQWIGRIADQLIPEFEQGMLLASGQNRFMAESYKASLQRFMGVVVGWMRQYEFDPVAVELGFGLKPPSLPAWQIDLEEGRKLSLVGRIDRVDLKADSRSGEARCVVIDYKSGQRRVDRVLLEHGIQQQLPAYLNVLRRLDQPRDFFGVDHLIPAGVFYVSLRGQYEAGPHRKEVLENVDAAERSAYTHQGFADLEVLRLLDNRPGEPKGDQIPYRLTQSGDPYKGSLTLLPKQAFLALLEAQERSLRECGGRIYRGDAQVDPWKKGRDCACDQCDFQSVCRIDPWNHDYRTL
jgi:ATP-dependent helicase/nuclease subunit B